MGVAASIEPTYVPDECPYDPKLPSETAILHPISNCDYTVVTIVTSDSTMICMAGSTTYITANSTTHIIANSTN